MNMKMQHGQKCNMDKKQKSLCFVQHYFSYTDQEPTHGLKLE